MKIPKKMKLWRVSYEPGTFSKIDFTEKIDQAAFKPIDDNPEETFSCGTASFDDLDDKALDFGISFGSWILFQWREDKRTADPKVVRRILEKRLRQMKKSGQMIGKATKTDLKEQIIVEQTRKAEPLPQVTPVYIHFTKNAIYYPVSSLKKLEAISEKIEEILGIEGGSPEMEDFDEDRASDWLESLWLDNISGKKDFAPKSVGNEDVTTISDDAQDLAFGKVNNKKCKSGTWSLNEASVDIGLNPRLLSVSLNLPKPEKDADMMEEMTMRLDMIADIFDIVEKHASGFAGAGADDDVFRNQAEIVLRN